MNDGIIIQDFWDFDSAPRMFRIGSEYKDTRQVLHDSAKSFKKGKALLEIRGPASFSGQLINGRVYPGLRMRNSLSTWTSDGSGRPFLLHHLSGASMFSNPVDPVGRVKSAEFIPYMSEGDLKNDHKNPSTKGSGELFLTSHIMDADAIEKVLDGRYKTVSVGFRTDHLFCSICNSDWMADGICEHRPLKRYKTDDDKEEKLAYMVTGDFDYREISFVNIPAARRAAVTSHELINSTLQDSFSDVSEEYAPFLDVQSIDLEFSSFSAGKKVYEIVHPEDRECVEVIEDEEKDPIILSDEEFAKLHILASLVDSKSLDYEKLFEDEGVSEEGALVLKNKLQDATLTAAQRKKMSAKTFCGPDKSFPVNDCQHYSTAKAFLDRYKGSGDKSKIAACIERRGRSLKCPTALKSSKDSAIYAKLFKDITNSIESGNLNDIDHVRDVFRLLNEGSSFEHTDKEVRSYLKNMNDNTNDSDCGNTESDVTPTETPEEGTVMPTDSLEQENNLLKASVEILEAKVETLSDENKELSGLVHSHLAETLFDLRVRNGHPAVSDLSEDEAKRNELVEVYKSRSRQSLEDAIFDERLQDKPIVEEAPETNDEETPQERGTITPEDVGVIVDSTKDTPEPKCEDRTPLSYRDRVKKALLS